MTLHSCEHCGTGFVPSEPDARFCCRGCEHVAALIHGRGLDRYYRLKEGTTTMPVRSRPFEEHDFSWLETRVSDSESSARAEVASMDCSVEGISCVGCVWLIASLFEDRPGAIRAAANPATGLLHLEWQPGSCDLREYLQELARFGYAAGPPTSAPTQGEMRSLAGRMGLCGAFMLNAMAFSLPGYLGMRPDFEFAGLFHLIAFASASLSMLVGAGYFIVRAWRAMRVRTLHIDLPIALGLIAAYTGSIIGWAEGEERLLYFDFVATFTFLMLLGRWIQTAAVEKTAADSPGHLPCPPRCAAAPVKCLSPKLHQVSPSNSIREELCLWDPSSPAPAPKFHWNGSAGNPIR
ncbi:MAG: heavy metal translocating P-type ATPase metal-binding domain-containing protein [Luteolibacter sp.]